LWSDGPVDSPDVGARVAETVSAVGYERGILVCGIGARTAIVAYHVLGEATTIALAVEGILILVGNLIASDSHL
jgi:ribose 5-phosphate isomerase RpiB